MKKLNRRDFLKAVLGVLALGVMSEPGPAAPESPPSVEADMDALVAAVWDTPLISGNGVTATGYDVPSGDEMFHFYELSNYKL